MGGGGGTEPQGAAREPPLRCAAGSEERARGPVQVPWPDCGPRLLQCAITGGRAGVKSMAFYPLQRRLKNNQTTPKSEKLTTPSAFRYEEATPARQTSPASWQSKFWMVMPPTVTLDACSMKMLAAMVLVTVRPSMACAGYRRLGPEPGQGWLGSHSQSGASGGCHWPEQWSGQGGCVSRPGARARVVCRWLRRREPSFGERGEVR